MNPALSLARQDGATAGVARVTGLTRLDAIGVPVVGVTRRDASPGSVSVYSAAAPTRAGAELRALAEAVERWAAEPERGHALRTTPVRPVPLELLSPSAPDAPAGPWLEGFALDGSGPRDLPAHSVLFPLPPPWPAAPQTSGLAWGLEPEGATRRALLELVERDAESRLLCLLATGAAPEHDLDRRALDAWTQRTLTRLEAAGVRVTLVDLTHDLGAPVVLCALVDPEGPVHQGVAARTTAHAAGRAALLEALQSRAVDLQGAREDIAPSDVAVHPWYLQRRPATQAPPPPLRRSLVAQVTAATGHPPVAVRLAAAQLAGAAVRVVAPGLELCAADPDRVGARAAGWLGG